MSSDPTSTAIPPLDPATGATAPAEGDARADASAVTPNTGGAAPAPAPNNTVAIGTIHLVGDPVPPAAPDLPQDGDDGRGEPPVRDAIILIPNLGNAAGTRVDDVALRMANAMDNCAADARAVFSVATRDVEMGKDRKVRTATILRHDTAKAEGRPLVDLYEFEYTPRLNRNFTDKPPYRQALAIALTLLANSPNLARAIGRPSKGVGQKLQIALGTGLFGALVLYLVLLVAAVIGTGVRPGKGGESEKVKTVADASTAAKAPTPVAARPASATADAPVLRAAGAPTRARQDKDAGRPWYVRLWHAFRTGPWLVWAQDAIVVLTLSGFVVRFNLREALGEAAPTLSSVTDYLAAGSHRNEIIGELARLINHLDESPPDGRPYRNVHVAAYSFGSVVALDALFQSETEVNPRFSRVHTLITIGSPFDFIRTFWPDYFTERRERPGTPTRWINVYSEVDVLGSNFLDEPSWRDKRRYRRADAAGKRAIEAEWASSLAQGVDLRSAEIRRPADADNISFGPGQSGTLSLMEYLRLTGFRVHAMYWDRQSPAAVSCFEPIVQRLYADDNELKVLV